ncbi:MAG: hypothetical protein WC728_08315 [Elusimicrobiota bacterium]
MTPEILALCGTAAVLGVTHTLLGPDHYLPFIVMGKAWRWSRVKLTAVTVLCGLAHVLSSVAIGAVGIALGVALSRMEGLEALRGGITGWLFLGFGLAYFVWGVHHALKDIPHSHGHFHADGTVHAHDHGHQQEHCHVHGEGAPNMTPWILFTLFVFGPCEPLIPVLMVPAARSSVPGLVLVASVFSAATIGTMLSVVLASDYGFSRLPFCRLERYSHALAGLTLLLCGAAMQFLGL